MNSRQRVWTTLNHQEPDRVPFDLGGTAVTGIHVKAYENFGGVFNLLPKSVEIADVFQQLANIGDDEADRLRIDVRSASLRSGPIQNLRYEEDGAYDLAYDSFQIGRRKPKDGGLYYDLHVHPLSGEITVADVDRYSWPDPLSPERFSGLKERAIEIADKQERAVVMGSLCAGIMEMHAFLRGYQDFYMDLVANPKLAGKIMDHIMEMKLAYWERALEILGDRVDVVTEADDMAGQQGMLISPNTYRKMIKPRHKVLFDFIHSKTKAKIFFHSCGAVRPVIPDLIEIGVDILNPIQVSANGMDSGELKREFGRELIFWGGGVDTQNILGAGTDQQVRDEVKRRLHDWMPGGGFVFAAVHNIQANVPPKNIVAMWETLQEEGIY